MTSERKGKKVVFVIVEGGTDATAIGQMFTRVFDSHNVRVEIMHKDITADSSVYPSNIVEKVASYVRNYAKAQFSFTPNDFACIIHITDTDGAFVNSDVVVQDESCENVVYTPTQIRTKDKAGIEKRNAHKRENLRKLISVNKIWRIPYSVYFMSCNLEHVLFNEMNCSRKEKIDKSINFSKRYRDCIEQFEDFILNSDFSVNAQYRQSWEYIAEGVRSLERHTNLGLCFSLK